MARIRSVKPGYFTSLDTAGQLSRDARLHFAGLWTYADDHGRGVDEPRLLKAAIWPLDDDIDNDYIERLQAELEDAGRLVRYVDTTNGRRYFEVANWSDHQKPNRPQDSSYPPPTAEQCTITERSLHEHGRGSEDASPEGRGEEGRGGESSPASDDAEVEASFDRFWSDYPRGPAGKPGGDGAKKPAWQKWRRLKPSEREACLDAVGNYRAHVESPDGPNAAHAITWLNQERWEQWQEPAEGPSVSVGGEAYAAMGDR